MQAANCILKDIKIAAWLFVLGAGERTQGKEGKCKTPEARLGSVGFVTATFQYVGRSAQGWVQEWVTAPEGMFVWRSLMAVVLLQHIPHRCQGLPEENSIH